MSAGSWMPAFWLLGGMSCGEGENGVSGAWCFGVGVGRGEVWIDWRDVVGVHSFDIEEALTWENLGIDWVGARGGSGETLGEGRDRVCRHPSNSSITDLKNGKLNSRFVYQS